MRVAIVYPPFMRGRQYPQLGQNRQFRFSYSKAVRIYPIVPSIAATILHQAGHPTLYLDGMNLRLSREEFDSRLWDFRPELIVMETKAPLIKEHWQFVTDVKARGEVLTALCGDHVSFFPEESLQCSPVDYCLTGGDYDVSLMGLVRHVSQGQTLPGGIYYREGGEITNSGEYQPLQNLDDLPFIDRELTGWQTYSEAYLHHPCTYIMSGRGCGRSQDKAGVCTFCVWQHALWRCSARLRSTRNVAEEIRDIVHRYQVKEIFDDNESGALWDKEWLRQFQREMNREGLVGSVLLSTNARADALVDGELCQMLKDTGVRLVKVGLESGSDETLKRLNKKETVAEIKAGIRTAKDHGLAVLITTMVGYPWETEEEVRQTYEVARELMAYKTHLGDSLQSSVIVPYPGTPLYRQAAKEGWLLYGLDEYEKYDMSGPVLKTEIDTERWCQRMWQLHYAPRFLVGTVLSIRSLDDVKLLARGVWSLLGHVRDYDRSER